MDHTTTLLTVLVLAVVAPSMADWHRTTFPNPQKDSDKCGRPKKSWICDPDGVLTASDANQLETLMNRVYNQTACPCSQYSCKRNNHGYRIAIAIVPNLLSDEEYEGQKNDEHDYKKENDLQTDMSITHLFAFNMLKVWKVGDCDDGILIAYNPTTYSLFTVTEQTAAKKLRPSIIGDISMVNRDLFGKSAFTGLQKMISDYRAVLTGSYKPTVYSGRPKAQAVRGRDGNGAAQLSVSAIAVVTMAAVSFLRL